MRMMQGIGFLMVLMCSTALDGGAWAIALVGCAIGAALMIAPMVMQKVRSVWTA